jgi:hypothetical protein
MFTEAIEKVSEFTRAMHTITRLYNTTEIIPGSTTLFLVNDEGWALTSKYAVELMVSGKQINATYEQFSEALLQFGNAPDRAARTQALAQQFKYSANTPVALHNTFMGCVDKITGLQWQVHPHYDLALIRFKGFNQLGCEEFPVFQADERYLKPGRFLCRLGFPFPSFTNFRYNPAADSIEWTTEGRADSPKFPVEGMITRFITNKGKTFGIEMSVPGFSGHSGSPLFDDRGVIQGMQFAVKPVYTGVAGEGKKYAVNHQSDEYAGTPLGYCIHVSVLKEFMTEHGVKFREE